MPHLQFEINKPIDSVEKVQFAKDIRAAFAKVMDTTTGHIAISLREQEKYNLSIGRVDPDDDVCIMNLDIREGRTMKQRRELALLFMQIVEDSFQIKKSNQYLTFTEHQGADFHLEEKYLSSWTEGENPLS